MSRTITPISERDFDQLRGVVRERAGVELEPTRRFAIGSRISRRLHELGLRDTSQYMSYLQGGNGRIDELDELLRLATLTETAFGRYPRQLESLRTETLPAIIDERRSVRRLRLWSAGCATGQEAYDLAMIVRDVLGVRIADWNVSILATEISQRALETARDGWYGPADARQLSADAIRNHFTHERGGVRVRQELREMVTFVPHNLNQQLPPSHPARLDLICCRNVLCHFGSGLRCACMKALRDRLTPDGVLLTGHRDAIEDEFFEPIGDPDAQSWRRATIGS